MMSPSPTPLPAESLAEPVTEAPAVTAARLRRVRCCPDCGDVLTSADCWACRDAALDALLDWARL